MGKAIRIKADEVVVSRRGRTAVLDTDLVDDLKSLKRGEAMDLTPYFGVVNGTADRQKVGAEIRKHWTAAGRAAGTCRIDFGAGKPQVRIKV